MSETNCDYIRMENLDRCITEIRNLLNEISASLEESGMDNERLIVSRCLDELIVEYMSEVKNVKHSNN